MMEKVRGKKQLVYNFEDLIAGSIRNAPIKQEKKLKDVSQLQFLHDRDLIKQFGLWTDTDKDKYLNFADSFPFDHKRHGLVAPQTATLMESQARLGLTPSQRVTQFQPQQVQVQPEKSAQEQEIESLQHNIKVTSERINELSKTIGRHTQGQGAAYADLVDTLPRLQRKLALMEEGYSASYASEVAFRRASPERRAAEQARREFEKQQQKGIIIGGGGAGTSTQSKLPFGYSNKDILDLYSKYQSQLSPNQRKRLTQYEQNQIITQNPSYQAELSQIKKGISQESQQRYVEKQGFVGTYPTQYGSTARTIYGTPTTPEQLQRDNSFIGGGTFGLISGEIGLPPTKTETYKRYVKDSGYVKGTFSYLGDILGSAYTRRELKQDRPYQPYASGRAISLATQVAPYFTPAGPILLLAGGVESLNQERVQRRKEDFESMGFGTTTSTALSYGLPVGEATLGFFGVKSQIGQLGRGEAIRNAVTKFVARETPVKPGTSQVDVIAKTTTGKEDVFAVLTGKSIQAPKGTISGSQGFIYSPEGRTYIRTIGTSQPRGDVSRIYKNLKETGVGEGFTGESATISYETKAGEVVQKINRAKYVGSGKKAGDITYVEAGKPEKLRIYRDEGLKVTTRPNIFGYVWRNTAPEEESVISNIIQRPTGIKKTPLSKTFGETKQVQVSKQAQQTALDLVTGARGESLKILQESVPAPLKFVPVSQYEGTGLYERTAGGFYPGESFGLSNLDLQRDRELTLFGTPTTTKTETKERTSFGTPTIQNLFIGTAERQGERVGQVPLITPKITEKEEGRSRLRPPTFYFPEEVPPGEPPPIIFGFGLPKKEKTLKEKPYDAYAYIDATKTNKARYEKLNEEPLTLMGALDKMSEFVDRNITARGKVSPTPPKIQKGKKIYQKVKEDAGETGYFEDNLYKFRPYRVQRGQKKPLREGTYIESAPYRLDSFGETGQIGQARIDSLIFNGFGNQPQKRKRKGFLI